jgi:hypothetical protein
MDFIAWIACALLCFSVKHASQLRVLLWFSMENYDNGVTISEFLLCRFLPPVWVSVVVTPLLLVVIMFHSSGLQCRLLRVALLKERA